MKIGDLIRDKRWPEDSYGVIISIGDRRARNPYLVWCCGNGRFEEFSKDYIEGECEVVQ